MNMDSITLVFSVSIAVLSTVAFLILLLRNKVVKELVPIFIGALFVQWVSVAFKYEQNSFFFGKYIANPLIVLVVLVFVYVLFCFWRMIKRHIQNGTPH